MTTRLFTRAALLVLGGLMLAACASDQGPADAALKAAEVAVNSVIAEATKYVPDQARAGPGCPQGGQGQLRQG